MQLLDFIWNLLKSTKDTLINFINFIKEIINFLPKIFDFLPNEVKFILLPIITIIVIVSIFKFLK